MKNKKKAGGFTLMELMITVAVIGILASIVVPSYQKQIQKVERSDGRVELMRLAQMQESYFVQNMTYAQDLTTNDGGLGLGTAVLSDQEQYTITMTATAADDGACNANTTATPVACAKYNIVATARSGTSQEKDSSCISFSISNTGAKSAATGTILSHTLAGAAQVKECWK